MEQSPQHQEQTMQANYSELKKGIKYIQLEGRLDLPGVMEFELKFTAYAASEKAGVVVDLSQVPFLASIGIRMLISSAKAVQKRCRMLVLLNPQPLVAELVTIAGISMTIPVYTDLTEACQDVRGTSS
jgi:anti-anti-sigma factor